MEIIKTLIWVVQIVSALTIIILVLLQHGKGADAGATFGSGGGSGSLFGAAGSANFLSRTTAIFATIFFISTFALVLLVSHGRVGDAGIMSNFHSKAVASGITPMNTIASSPAKTNSSHSVNASGAATTTKAAAKENQIPQ